MGEKEEVQYDSLNLDYDATVSLEKIRIQKEFRKLRMTVTLKKKIARSIIEIISPPGILVIVSWVMLHEFYYFLRFYRFLTFFGLLATLMESCSRAT